MMVNQSKFYSMSGHRLHILIVDDDPDDLQMIADAFKLQAPTSNILTFQNSRNALGYIDGFVKDPVPSIIVLDYNMPAIKGIELLKIVISRKEFNPSFKVVWSTSQDYREECSASGADLYFVKPYKLDDLAKMVCQILSAVS
jgi:DNA-binding NarL/FixJ family response regulator